MPPLRDGKGKRIIYLRANIVIFKGVFGKRHETVGLGNGVGVGVEVGKTGVDTRYKLAIKAVFLAAILSSAP